MAFRVTRSKTNPVNGVDAMLNELRKTCNRDKSPTNPAMNEVDAQPIDQPAQPAKVELKKSSKDVIVKIVR